MPNQRQTNTAQRVTNADLAAEIKGLGVRVDARLDKLEVTVMTAGLNGHTELLKSFLDREAKRIDSKAAYSAVGRDLKAKLGFLVVPKNWLRALFYAALGGLGWKLVSNLPPVHF